MQIHRQAIARMNRVSSSSAQEEGNLSPIPTVTRIDLQEEPQDPEISSLLEVVKEGLLYHIPELCEEGVNGTYFLQNPAGKRVAIFKPIDEEGNVDNNPKRTDALAVHPNTGLISGEGAVREIAAYLLDTDHFSCVPRTVMVQLTHPSFSSVNGMKIGSLQEYVMESEGSADDMGPKNFRVHDVHKIGILDLRIFNNDRHGGNILLVESGNKGYTLIPIDHGFSLSPSLSCGLFEWLNWPQAKMPFDNKTKQYIQLINVDEDAQLLAKLGIREECIKTMRICTTLLKKGVAAGLTLYDIGSFSSRTVPEQPCMLEVLFNHVAEQYQMEEQKQLEALWKLMDIEVANSLQCTSPRSSSI